MKTTNIYEIGEQVMIKARVFNVEIEKGKLKYTLKDEKSNRIYGWTFDNSDIVQISEQKETDNMGDYPEMPWQFDNMTGQ